MIEKTLPKILPVARVTICLFLRYDKVRHPLLYHWRRKRGGGGGGGGQGGHVPPHFFDRGGGNGMFVPPTFNPTFLFST